MVLAGASGHAKDILVFFNQTDPFVLFDDQNEINDFFQGIKILKSLNEVEHYFKSNTNNFCLATGSPKSRNSLCDKLENLGGEVVSIIAPNSIIGTLNVHLGEGLNVLGNTFISNGCSIGKGSLLNFGVQIHHDCSIGKFCEISPRAVILGGVTVGNYCSIGSSATILPKVKIGDNVLIGAGAVVLRDVPNNSIVVGVPGKIIKKNN